MRDWFLSNQRGGRSRRWSRRCRKAGSPPKPPAFSSPRRFFSTRASRPSGVEVDRRPPVLRFKQLPLTEASRFIYGARALPFIGRDSELKSIDAFLGDHRSPFGRMLLYGSAGVGKSRLAMERHCHISDFYFQPGEAFIGRRQENQWLGELQRELAPPESAILGQRDNALVGAVVRGPAHSRTGPRAVLARLCRRPLGSSPWRRIEATGASRQPPQRGQLPVSAGPAAIRALPPKDWPVGEVLTMGSARGAERQPFKFYV